MIKTILQAPPQIISNLKRKLIGHLHVLEQVQSNQEEKVSQNKHTLLSKKNSCWSQLRLDTLTHGQARKQKETYVHVTLR